MKMPYEVFEIKYYRLAMGNQLKRAWNGVTSIFNGYVICYGDAYRIVVYFLTENSPVPAPEYIPEKKFAVMFVPSKERGEYVDVLRNEAPVFGYVYKGRPDKTMIMTKKEEVGDGEID